MAKVYDLSDFINSQRKQTQEPATIKLAEGKVYPIKRSAFSTMSLGFLYQKHGNEKKPEVFISEVIKTFLGDEAWNFLQSQKVSEVVMTEIVTIIINHIAPKEQGSDTKK